MATERIIASRDGVTITAEAIGIAVWASATGPGEKPDLQVVYARNEAAAGELLAGLRQRLADDGYDCDATPAAENHDTDEP